MGNRSWNYVWTRPQDLWEQDRKILDQISQKFKILHISLTRQEAIQNPVFPEDLPKSLFIIITSRRASQILIEKYPGVLDGRSVLTFGNNTSRHLLRHKILIRQFKDCNSSKQLAIRICEEFSKNSKFLYIAAKDPAYDLVGHLNEGGFECMHVPVYQTTLYSDSINKKVEGQLLGADGNLFAFASPLAVECFSQWMKKCERRATLGTNSYVLCIGPTTAQAALKSWDESRIRVAKVPSVAELIELSAEWQNLKKY